MAFATGAEQRCDAVTICLVDGSVGIEQQLHTVGMAIDAGAEQSRDALGVRMIGGGADGEQQLCALELSCCTSKHQGCSRVEAGWHDLQKLRKPSNIAVPDRIVYRNRIRHASSLRRRGRAATLSRPAANCPPHIYALPWYNVPYCYI